MLTKLLVVLSTLLLIIIPGLTNTTLFLLINPLVLVFLMLTLQRKFLKTKIKLLNNSSMLLINFITLLMDVLTKLA